MDADDLIQTDDLKNLEDLLPGTGDNQSSSQIIKLGGGRQERTDRGGVYIGASPKPATGWTAFFVELTYPSGGKYPFKFTTAVRIVPDVLPFPPTAR